MTFIRRKVKRLKTEKTVNKLGVASVAIAATQLAPLAATNVAHAASYSQQSFINQLGSVAREVANDNDLYASVMIAQAILESNWGNSGLSRNANNLFGIKGAFNNQSVIMRTAEQRPDGTVYYLNEPFRKYPSVKESMLDYVSVVKGSRFYSGAWKSNTTSYQQATKHLTGRYATAINYNTVLNNIITTYNLTQFDTPHVANTTTAVRSSNNQQTNHQSNGTYTVVRGDSVWAVAMRFNMTMTDVVLLNNIKNNFIYPGQVLKVNHYQYNNTVSTTPKVMTKQHVVSQTNHSQSTGEYTVVRGDSVWLIANKYGMSMDTLVSLNGIKNYFIYPGQKLIVSTTPTQTPARAINTNANTYVVKSGDSVWLIANKFGITMNQLRQSNNIKNNFIYPGQQLHIK